MKNLITAITLLLSFIFITSCNNDETSVSESTDIVGKWTLVSYQISNFESTATTVDDWQGTFPRPTFEFKSNNKFSDNLINGNMREMNYEVKDGRINLEKSIAFETHNSFAYAISGSKLELRRDDRHSLPNGTYFTESTVIVLQK